MKRTGVPLTGLFLFLAVIPAAGAPGPFPGRLTLMKGCTSLASAGIDSDVGTITCPSGLEMKYDIGEMAGVYTDPNKLTGWTKGEVWRKTQLVENQKMVVVFTNDKTLLISFPRLNANFYATIKTEEQLTEMLLIATSYRPSEHIERRSTK